MDWQKLFGDPKDRKRNRRLARAREWMAEGEFNEARMELEGWRDPEAQALHAECLRALVLLNLEAWSAYRAAGEAQESGSALSRARQFGASPQDLAEAGVHVPGRVPRRPSGWRPRA